MAKSGTDKKYTGEFKQMVVETMRKELLSYQETARRFEVRSDTQVKNWERIYLEEGLKVCTLNVGEGKVQAGRKSSSPKPKKI